MDRSAYDLENFGLCLIYVVSSSGITTLPLFVVFLRILFKIMIFYHDPCVDTFPANIVAVDTQ